MRCPLPGSRLFRADRTTIGSLPDLTAKRSYQRTRPRPRGAGRRRARRCSGPPEGHHPVERSAFRRGQILETRRRGAPERPAPPPHRLKGHRIQNGKESARAEAAQTWAANAKEIRGIPPQSLIIRALRSIPSNIRDYEIISRFQMVRTSGSGAVHRDRRRPRTRRVVIRRRVVDAWRRNGGDVQRDPGTSVAQRPDLSTHLPASPSRTSRSSRRRQSTRR
jgi:hypothetical protein